MLLKKLALYLGLARFHQPAGIWLLLWPCWWSIAMASEKPSPEVYLLALFAIGATAMRAAGCIINDIIDRKIDAQVERTKNRPLASGAIGISEAFWVLAVFLAFGLVVLVQLNALAITIALASCALVVLYPFMKRITGWPQVFLALTFNIGALVGWVAVKGRLELPAFLIYGAGIFWTLGYDTIYAHQDKWFDRKIGVKSSALSLKEKTKAAVGLFYLTTVVLLLLAGRMIFVHHNTVYYGALLAGLFHLAWQVRFVSLDNPNDCMRKFRSNVWFGWIVFGGMLLEKALSYL